MCYQIEIDPSSGTFEKTEMFSLVSRLSESPITLSIAHAELGVCVPAADLASEIDKSLGPNTLKKMGLSADAISIGGEAYLSARGAMTFLLEASADGSDDQGRSIHVLARRMRWQAIREYLVDLFHYLGLPTAGEVELVSVPSAALYLPQERRASRPANPGVPSTDCLDAVITVIREAAGVVEGYSQHDLPDSYLDAARRVCDECETFLNDLPEVYSAW